MGFYPRRLAKKNAPTRTFVGAKALMRPFGDEERSRETETIFPPARSFCAFITLRSEDLPVDNSLAWIAERIGF
jgi:hypothetical protein